MIEDEYEFDDEDFESDSAKCPECGVYNYAMGILGTIMHFSCRFCGIWYSVKSIVSKEKVTNEVCE